MYKSMFVSMYVLYRPFFDEDVIFIKIFDLLGENRLMHDFYSLKPSRWQPSAYSKDLQ